MINCFDSVGIIPREIKKIISAQIKMVKFCNGNKFKFSYPFYYYFLSYGNLYKI